MLVVSRLLLGVVGAGFVVGIRMVSEWFPPAELGTAEGVYGGWGNFGAAAAACSPCRVVASAIGGPTAGAGPSPSPASSPRPTASSTSGPCTDTPDGVPYARPRKAAGARGHQPTGACSGSSP